MKLLISSLAYLSAVCMTGAFSRILLQMDRSSEPSIFLSKQEAKMVFPRSLTAQGFINIQALPNHASQVAQECHEKSNICSFEEYHEIYDFKPTKFWMPGWVDLMKSSDQKIRKYRQDFSDFKILKSYYEDLDFYEDPCGLEKIKCNEKNTFKNIVRIFTNTVYKVYTQYKTLFLLDICFNNIRWW